MPRPRRSWCGGADCGGGIRWCRRCRNAYIREWRAAGHEKPVDRAKHNARNMMRMRVSRGTLQRQPCRDCGAPKAEKHHPDYSRPDVIVWMCPACHRAEHKRMREAS